MRSRGADINGGIGIHVHQGKKTKLAAPPAGEGTDVPPSPQSFRARQRARLLVEIRRTSLRMFAERGFDEVTVDEIAAAVGVSKSTFFRHVPTKEALVIDPMIEGISGIVDLFEARPRTESVRDALTHAAIECTREVSTDELAFWSKALRTAPHLVTRISLVSDVDRVRLIELATERLHVTHPGDASPRHAGLVVTVMLAAASYAFQCWIIDNEQRRDALEEQLQTALMAVKVSA